MTADGLNYAPVGRPAPVCSPGDFVFAAVGLDHGHINGMCNGLIEAGGQLRWVYDRDPDTVAQFRRRYPGVQAAPTEESVLADARVHLVASALGLGPHRVNAPSRPAWFFDHEATGGILCDIGSHQLEQVLYYGGCDEAVITAAVSST